MKNRLLWCLSLFMMLSVSSAFSQTGGLRGKVIDASTGETLPLANILIKELERGTTSDTDGNYAITNIPVGTYTIESTFVGYKRFSTRVTITEGVVTLNINFEPQQIGLDELVVVGYGVQSKREVTGAISQVKAEQIENLPIQSLDQALQGRAAGVQITSNSGAPGGSMRVRIRGFGSINASNTPLYVVDGVQMADLNAQGSSQASSNPLAGINPNDILSIEVLKDAAAASIYGAQAANGVVLITTKQGRTGSSIISINSSVGFTSQPNRYELMDTENWLNTLQKAYINYANILGLDEATYARSALTTYIPGCTAALYNAGAPECNPALQPNYDWQGAVYQLGVSRDLDASISGGNESTRFFVSAAYENTEGSAIRTDFKRMSFRANLDHRVNSKLSVESRINLNSNRQFGAVSDGNYINGPFFMAAWMPTIYPIYNEDGSYNENVFYTNVLQEVNLVHRGTRQNSFQGNFALNYRLPENFVLRVFAGTNFRQTRDTNVQPSTLPSARAYGGQVFEANREVYSYNVNSTLSYNKSINNEHNINTFIGAEYKEESQEAFTATGRGFASSTFDIINLAANPQAVSGTATTFRTASLFGQFKYDYNNRYSLNTTLRYDGSSRFGANNRYGLFYAFSGFWNLANESFFTLPEAVNDLKLRAGYGITGNSGIGNFASRALFGNGGTYNGMAGLTPSQLGNESLTWEESASLNLGLDWAMFEGRITGSFDLYRKDNKRLLMSRSLPSDSGFGSVMENAGKVRNEGYEFEISTVNVDRGGFTWTSSFNITSNRNRLIELPGGAERIGNSYIVGEPLRFYWGVRWAGVNPADGRQMWYDKDGNITYQVVTADQQVLERNIEPVQYGGLSNTFSYKGLTLDVFFAYDFGSHTFDQQVEFFLMDINYAGNFLTRMNRHWANPGDVTDFPRLYPTRTESGMSSSTTSSGRQIKDTSFIRLKNATISYQVPNNIVNKIGMRTLKVFATGHNLLTWTPYEGIDPEFATNAAAPYPQGRTIRTGLQVQF